MSTVNLKDEYRTETDEDVYAEENLYGGTGSYTDDYVNWLETKLKNNEALDLVSKSSDSEEFKIIEGMGKTLTSDTTATITTNHPKLVDDVPKDWRK